MKILVTGASGFIGSELIKSFSNDDVIALTRDKRKNDKNIKYVIGDITQGLPKLPKADIIFHYAGMTLNSTKNPSSSDYFRVNSYGTYNLLNKALESNIKNIVFSSTIQVYDVNQTNVKENVIPKPNNSYGSSKVIAEEICKYFANHLGLKIIVFRYSGVYGIKRPRGFIYDLFQNAIKNNIIKVKTGPEGKFDSVYIKDIVNVNRKIIDFIQKTKNNFQVFNIGYGKPIIVKELVNKIIKITKSKSEVQYLKEIPDANFWMNTQKANKILNYVPPNIDDSLSDYYQELIKNTRYLNGKN